MAVLTNFLKLLKPERNDYVDVEKHISENYDKIDNKIQELDKKASKTQLGRVIVGDNLDIDEEGKITHPAGAGYKHIPAGGAVGQVLKNNGDGSAEWGTLDIKDKLNRGNLPATIPDGKTIYDLLENNGGLNMDPNLLYLNDAGEKTKGKVYFDKNKKGLFECIETTSSTTNSTTYFVDISNKANADRFGNLPTIDYSSKIDINNPINGYTATENGYLRIYLSTSLTRGTLKYTINNVEFVLIENYNGGSYPSLMVEQIVPIAKNDIFKVSDSMMEAQFFRLKKHF